MTTNPAPGSGSMTKRDLIDEVVKIYPRFSGRDAEVIVNAVFDSMTEALARGERIEIRGFGSFVVKHRQAREGRNPEDRRRRAGGSQARAVLQGRQGAEAARRRETGPRERARGEPERLTWPRAGFRSPDAAALGPVADAVPRGDSRRRVLLLRGRDQ